MPDPLPDLTPEEIAELRKRFEQFAGESTLLDMLHSMHWTRAHAAEIVFRAVPQLLDMTARTVEAERKATENAFYQVCDGCEGHVDAHGINLCAACCEKDALITNADHARIADLEFRLNEQITRAAELERRAPSSRTVCLGETGDYDVECTACGRSLVEGSHSAEDCVRYAKESAAADALMCHEFSLERRLADAKVLINEMLPAAEIGISAGLRPLEASFARENTGWRPRIAALDAVEDK